MVSKRPRLSANHRDAVGRERYALASAQSLGATVDPEEARGWAYATLLKRLSLDVPYVGLFDGDSVVALAKAFSWPSYGAYSTEGFWPLDVRPTAR